MPQRKVMTPSTVAKEYFGRELEQHATAPSQTVVIVHDSCYGHRFSRPRTSKAALSTIVERPERILATLLGVSTAYIRLGSRHADGTYPPHPDKEAPTDSAPFHLRKTTRTIQLSDASVTAVHGTKWMEELQVMCDTAESKLAMNGKELARPIGYGKDEMGKALPKLHEGDLYLCSESLAALQGCLGGVCEAVDSVFSSKVTERAFVCIRPPGHHCSSNFPSGFCWLNNVHVGISYAAMNHGLTHAAIIDFDLHHGDGSQTVTWEHNKKAQALPKNAAAHKKTPIGYYSLHDINSYPCEWGDDDKVRNASLCVENAHGQSIWNVHLEPWSSLAEFWQLYETRYVVLLEKTKKFLRYHTEKLRQANIQPKASVFISAGFDASEWEGAGMQRHGVNVPTDFYERFTKDIVKMAQEEDLGVNGRVISVLEGGYSDRALTSGVLSHICGLVGNRSRSDGSIQASGVEASMGQMINGESSDQKQDFSSVDQYNPTWWNIESLERLEAIAAGKLPPTPAQKDDKAPGNYSSPTAASSAKMTDVAKERSSVTARLEARLSMIEKPPPPPPDVDWAVGAYELSRLIIPSDRQTLSCRHDELNAEATRIRKERQSTIGVSVVPTGEPMQLRERRAKAPPLPRVPSRSSSRTRNDNRRTTIASFSDLPDARMSDIEPATGVNGRRRRSSAASSIVSGISEMKLGHTGKDATGTPSISAASGANIPPAEPTVTTKPKTTATRKPRTTATKASAPGKPAPRKTGSAIPPLSRQSSTASDKNLLHHQPASGNQSHQVSGLDDIDSITDAMNNVSIKSIKLNMPTEEQHTANQKKREDEQRLKPTKPTRKPAVPRNVKNKAPPKPTTAPAPTPAFANGQAWLEVKGEESTSQPVPIQEPAVAGPVLQTSAETTRQVTQHSHADEYSTQAVDAQAPKGNVQFPMAPPPFPEQHAQESTTMLVDQDVATGQVESAASKPIDHGHPQATPAAGSWSVKSNMPPPATTGPSSRPMTPNRKTKADLPVFTSTSPIPFSSRTNNTLNEDDTKHEPEGRSIWDLPETPR
jgi:histone deacetylase HOS3